MPASELYEWMAYDEIEPIGERRGDIQAGIAAAATFNVTRSKSTDKVFSPTDFIPNLDRELEATVQQTPEQQRDIMLLIQAMTNTGLKPNA